VSTQTTIREWIGMNETTRLTGRGPNVTYRNVVLGKIRVLLEPGVPPRYSRQDVERLAAEFEGKGE
jgi:hypothetical protein